MGVLYYLCHSLYLHDLMAHEVCYRIRALMHMQLAAVNDRRISRLGYPHANVRVRHVRLGIDFDDLRQLSYAPNLRVAIAIHDQHPVMQMHLIRTARHERQEANCVRRRVLRQIAGMRHRLDERRGGHELEVHPKVRRRLNHILEPRGTLRAAIMEDRLRSPELCNREGPAFVIETAKMVVGDAAEAYLATIEDYMQMTFKDSGVPQSAALVNKVEVKSAGSRWKPKPKRCKTEQADTTVSQDLAEKGIDDIELPAEVFADLKCRNPKVQELDGDDMVRSQSARRVLTLQSRQVEHAPNPIG